MVYTPSKIPGGTTLDGFSKPYLDQTSYTLQVVRNPLQGKKSRLRKKPVGNWISSKPLPRKQIRETRTGSLPPKLNRTKKELFPVASGKKTKKICKYNRT